MYTDFVDWLTNIGLVFLVVIVIIWGLKYKSIPKSIQLIGFYFLANLFIQLIADFLWRRSLNNLPLLHLNTILEFIFISLFFREIFIGFSLFKKYFLHIVIGISILLVINSIFWESLNSFNTYAKSFVQVIIIGYVIAYFFDIFGRIDLEQKGNQGIIIICFAILLNYSGSLFIFMFSQFFPGTKNLDYEVFWVLNACLTFIFQFIILIAISRIIFYKKD